MSEKEGVIKIYTKSEKAKRTILGVIQEKTGMKIIIPKGELELQQSVYDEVTVRIIQEIILSNEASLVTLEPLHALKEKVAENMAEQDKIKTKRKGFGGRPNKMLEKIISCLESKKQVTIKDLKEATGSSYAGIKKNLEKLLAEEKIVCLEKGKWRLKKFYDDCLDLPEYRPIVDYIVEYKTIQKEKLITNFQPEHVEIVLKELTMSSFINKVEEDKYEVSLEFRVWYHIRQNPHIQWTTLKVYMGQKLIDTNTLSSVINTLTRNKKIKKDGKRGYVII